MTGISPPSDAAAGPAPQPPDPPGPLGSLGSLGSLVTPLRILAVCAAVATLRFAAPVLLPVVVAVLVFYALSPLVDRVTRWRVPRVLASVLVVVAVLGVTGASALALWPQVDAVVARVPEGATRLRTTLRRARGGRPDSALERVQAAASAIDSAAAEAAEPAPQRPGVTRVEIDEPIRVSDWLWLGGVGALGLLGQGVTVLFLTLFLLNEDDSFKRKLVRQMETLGSKRVTVSILNDIARQIQSFLWVQIFTSVLVAVLTALALWWLGVEQPAAWGLFAGLLNVVPYFGALIVTVVLTAVGYLQFGTIGSAALVGGLTFLITSLEGMLLTPHFLSRAASLNHVAIFLAIAFWSWAWGVPGMLLAVPMLMAIKAVCDHVQGLRVVGEFLGK
ncbi:MAG: AI-2E family transporter [Vicinamibacterales bacterium]